MTIRVLLIDDELGRPERASFVGRLFESRRVLGAPGGEQYWVAPGSAAPVAGSRGLAGLVPDELYVCTAQELVGGAPTNSRALVEAALRYGWPNPAAGWRWALAVIDLTFLPAATFGHEVFEVMRRVAPELVGVAFTNRKGAEVERALADVAGAAMSEMLPKDGAGSATGLRGALRRHGLIPDVGGPLVGRSLPWMSTLREARGRAGQRGMLLRGPIGSGKEMIAEYVHHWSGVRGEFQKFTLAAGAEDPQILGLFGGSKGDFTGSGERPGVFERANGGTVFLDELHNAGLETQGRLLGPLEADADRKYRVSRVGGVRVEVDVRTIGATNLERSEIDQRRESGALRSDLLDRLDGDRPIEIPGLKTRLDDLPLLVEHFLRRAEGEHPDAVRRDVDATALERIGEAVQRADGNMMTVRWLREVMRTAVAKYPRIRFLLADHVELGAARSRESPPVSSATSRPERSVALAGSSLRELLDAMASLRPAGMAVRDLQGALRQGEEAWARLSALLYIHAWESQVNPDRTAIVSALAGIALAGTKVTDQLNRWASLWRRHDIALPEWLREDIEKASNSRKQGRTGSSRQQAEEQ